MESEQPDVPAKGKNKTLLLVLGGIGGCGCLVVLVVVGVAMWFAPAVTQQVEVLKVEAARAEMQAMVQQVKSHALLNGGALPGSLADVDWPSGETPVDLWGQPFQYEPSADGTAFTLTCLGADGAPGGEGTDADIVIASAPAGAGAGN